MLAETVMGQNNPRDRRAVYPVMVSVYLTDWYMIYVTSSRLSDHYPCLTLCTLPQYLKPCTVIYFLHL